MSRRTARSTLDVRRPNRREFDRRHRGGKKALKENRKSREYLNVSVNYFVNGVTDFFNSAVNLFSPSYWFSKGEVGVEGGPEPSAVKDAPQQEDAQTKRNIAKTIAQETAAELFESLLKEEMGSVAGSVVKEKAAKERKEQRRAERTEQLKEAKAKIFFENFLGEFIDKFLGEFIDKVAEETVAEENRQKKHTISEPVIMTPSTSSSSLSSSDTGLLPTPNISPVRRRQKRPDIKAGTPPSSDSSDRSDSSPGPESRFQTRPPYTPPHASKSQFLKQLLAREMVKDLVTGLVTEAVEIGEELKKGHVQRTDEARAFLANNWLLNDKRYPFITFKGSAVSEVYSGGSPRDLDVEIICPDLDKVVGGLPGKFGNMLRPQPAGGVTELMYPEVAKEDPSKIETVRYLVKSTESDKMIDLIFRKSKQPSNEAWLFNFHGREVPLKQDGKIVEDPKRELSSAIKELIAERVKFKVKGKTPAELQAVEQLYQQAFIDATDEGYVVTNKNNPSKKNQSDKYREHITEKCKYCDTMDAFWQVVEDKVAEKTQAVSGYSR